MLWKPSASNSLWDARRLPSLPDMGAALNRNSSFEYESAAAAGKAQEPPAEKDNGSRGKPVAVAKQDFALKSDSKGWTPAGFADSDRIICVLPTSAKERNCKSFWAAAPSLLQCRSEQLGAGPEAFEYCLCPR